MKLQAWLLAPVTASIVVALMAVTVEIMMMIQGLYEKLQTSVSSIGGNVGVSAFQQLVNFQKLVGPWLFQLTMGIYLIEVVFILSYFVAKIEHGGESVIRNFEIARTLFIAMGIYTTLVFITYYSLSSIAKMVL